MGRSDSRSGPLPGLCFPLERRGSTPPPRRVSQAPRLICPHALSPFTPESPKAAVAHCFTSGNRLHHTWKTGHFPFALTGPYRVCGHYGSRVRRPELCQSDRSFPRLVGYLLYEQLQGKLLSAYKISQAFPGVPGPRYACLTSIGHTPHHEISAWAEPMEKPDGSRVSKVGFGGALIRANTSLPIPFPRLHG
jgi:hypothetical protein